MQLRATRGLWDQGQHKLVGATSRIWSGLATVDMSSPLWLRIGRFRFTDIDLDGEEFTRVTMQGGYDPFIVELPAEGGSQPDTAAERVGRFRFCDKR